MFDNVIIKIKAGDGGNGAVSFRREKFVPFGGPDGGDGGDGANVVVKVDPTVTSLGSFKNKRSYRAGNGEPGKGRRKHGKRGEDLILTVPVGTVISYEMRIGDNAIISDLQQPGEQRVVAKGGKGGRGNATFVSSTYQAPRVAQKGGAGEESSVIFELRLIADVGVIGYPNVGKSALLATVSAAKPKIANYPFTTRGPVLGVVEIGMKAFILAEIPGLIADAHLGRGLGHDFLRHITRTKMLIHLIDGTSPSPVEDMMKVNGELCLFDSALAQKKQLVAVNKIDLPEVQVRLAEIEDSFAAAGLKVFFISAITKEGVLALMAETMNMLSQLIQHGTAPETPKKVFRPQPRITVPAVHKEGEVFIITAPELERGIARIGEISPGVRLQLQRQLQRLGGAKALARAGVKPGDRVRCGQLEWEWG